MSERITPEHPSYNIILNAFNRNRPSSLSKMTQNADALNKRWTWHDDEGTLVFIEVAPVAPVGMANQPYEQTSFQPRVLSVPVEQPQKSKTKPKLETDPETKE